MDVVLKIEEGPNGRQTLVDITLGEGIGFKKDVNKPGLLGNDNPQHFRTLVKAYVDQLESEGIQVYLNE